MHQWSAFTIQQIMKLTEGCPVRCPECRCFSIRVPNDGSPPFCVMGECDRAYQPDPRLRPGAPNLRAVKNPDE